MDLIEHKRKEWDLGELRNQLVGQRIARVFADRPTADGDVVFRATVAGIQDIGKTIDDDTFFVVYDNGEAKVLQVRFAPQCCIVSSVTHIAAALHSVTRSPTFTVSSIR